MREVRDLRRAAPDQRILYRFVLHISLLSLLSLLSLALAARSSPPYFPRSLFFFFFSLFPSRLLANPSVLRRRALVCFFQPPNLLLP